MKKILKTGMAVAATTWLTGVSSATMRYVNMNSTNATPPYTNWVTAATNIQDAVNAAAAGDEVVVSNGVYRGGLNVTNPLTLLSVNGPQFTVINGGHSNRCATLTSGASLTGFTLTNGHSGGHWLVVTQHAIYRYFPGRGGGVSGGTLYNCTLTGNSADIGGGASESTLYNCTLSDNRVTNSYSWGVVHVHYGTGGGADSCILHDCTLTGNRGDLGDSGGGAYESTLYNCRLTGNSASYGGGTSGGTLYNCTLSGNRAYSGGGGTEGSTLYNCTLTGNSAFWSGGATFGGGTEGGTLYNCIVYSNTATNGANFDTWSVLNYCCTTPLPTNGVGNITNEPAFVNAAAGDFHLQTNSPCINAGNNAYVTTATDLDGHPRIVSGTVDIGAYEFQGSGSLISYAWLQHYGWPTDDSADSSDPDNDGMNNWQEWRADTSPLDADDYLHITSFTRSGTYNTLWWASKSTRLYQVERRASLDAASPWETIITNAVLGWNNVGFDNLGPQYFYRIRAVRP